MRLLRYSPPCSYHQLSAISQSFGASGGTGSVTVSLNSLQAADVTITAPVTNPRMVLDGPVTGTTVPQPLVAGGWAVDLGASSGSGVNAVHVWAFPVVNGVVNPANRIFVAQGTSGGPRPDVGAVFGGQFTNSGYTFVISGLSPGVYDLGVYARSTVTNTFNQVKFVRITIP